MSDWQPIETAPVSDLQYPSSDFTCIVFANGIVGEAQFMGQPNPHWQGWWWANTDHEHWSEIFPTHWTHLPERPEQ